MISTLYSGAASLHSPVARAGGFAASTQASQTAFISGNVVMSASQMVAERMRDLSEPASASSRSI
jgi:hypothetical protein